MYSSLCDLTKKDTFRHSVEVLSIVDIVSEYSDVFELRGCDSITKYYGDILDASLKYLLVSTRDIGQDGVVNHTITSSKSGHH